MCHALCWWVECDDLVACPTYADNCFRTWYNCTGCWGIWAEHSRSQKVACRCQWIMSDPGPIHWIWLSFVQLHQCHYPIQYMSNFMCILSGKVMGFTLSKEGWRVMGKYDVNISDFRFILCLQNLSCYLYVKSSHFFNRVERVTVLCIIPWKSHRFKI